MGLGFGIFMGLLGQHASEQVELHSVTSLLRSRNHIWNLKAYLLSGEGGFFLGEGCNYSNTLGGSPDL